MPTPKLKASSDLGELEPLIETILREIGDGVLIYDAFGKILWQARVGKGRRAVVRPARVVGFPSYRVLSGGRPPLPTGRRSTSGATLPRTGVTGRDRA